MKDMIRTEYALLIEEEKSKPKPNMHGIQTKLAKRFKTNRSYVSRCLAEFRDEGNATPTQRMVSYAEKLKDQAVQLEMQLEYINECDERIKRSQDIVDEVYDSVYESKGIIQEMRDLMDRIDPDDILTIEENFKSIESKAMSKNSPFNMMAKVDRLQHAIDIERKETLAKNVIITSINSARKLIVAINNMYYGGDPTNWDQRTMDKTIRYLMENVCPHCPGFDAMKAGNSMDIEFEDDDETDSCDGDVFDDTEVVDFDDV